jgi:hypothetical protein
MNKTKNLKISSKYLVTVLVAVFAVIFTTKASFAREVGCDDPNQVPALYCLEPIFLRVLRAISALVGLSSFIFIIAGGFKYLTAGGDVKAMSSAKKTLAGALAGLIITFGLYFVLGTILGLFTTGTGTPLKIEFRLPMPFL